MCVWGLAPARFLRTDHLRKRRRVRSVIGQGEQVPARPRHERVSVTLKFNPYVCAGTRTTRASGESAGRADVRAAQGPGVLPGA